MEEGNEEEEEGEAEMAEEPTACEPSPAPEVVDAPVEEVKPVARAIRGKRGKKQQPAAPEPLKEVAGK